MINRRSTVRSPFSAFRKTSPASAAELRTLRTAEPNAYTRI
uniref:Uncharacterized protein n=1 Tax=Anguilla anguilla TaxID=7936 RepID=A0A0E9XXK1_ANGAN